MLGLHQLINATTDSLWIELVPGKDFEFARVKKVVPEIADMIRSIPGVKKNVSTYFTGDNGFYVSGDLKEQQDVRILQRLLQERIS